MAILVLNYEFNGPMCADKIGQLFLNLIEHNGKGGVPFILDKLCHFDN